MGAAICQPLRRAPPVHRPAVLATQPPNNLEVSVPSLPALWNDCAKSPSTSCSSRSSTIRQHHCESFSSLDGCIGEEPDRMPALDPAVGQNRVHLPPRSAQNVALVYKVRRSPKRRLSHTVMRASPNEPISLPVPRDRFLFPSKPPAPRRGRRADTLEDLL